MKDCPDPKLIGSTFVFVVSLVYLFISNKKTKPIKTTAGTSHWLHEHFLLLLTASPPLSPSLSPPSPRLHFPSHNGGKNTHFANPRLSYNPDIFAFLTGEVLAPGSEIRIIFPTRGGGRENSAELFL